MSPRLARALLASLLALACLPAAPGWRAPLGRDHPLTGAILEVPGGERLSFPVLVERLATARWVLLGEKHDNPDHHRLQARVIDALAARGQRRAAVFEMLDLDRAGALRAQRAERPPDVDALARAVDWEHSGWPEWSLYRPVFAAALRADWRIEPANLPRALLERMRTEGPGALDPELAVRMRPLGGAARMALAAEIALAHCGMAPPGAIDAMIAAQRARDASFARALEEGAGADGAVLIAGAGHVRRDRGVPAYLERPDRTLVVGFHEVATGADDAAALAAAHAGAFDYLWLTPRVDDLDPCERFREQLERMRAPREAASLSARERPAAARAATRPAPRGRAPSAR